MVLACFVGNRGWAGIVSGHSLVQQLLYFEFVEDNNAVSEIFFNFQ